MEKDINELTPVTFITVDRKLHDSIMDLHELGKAIILAQYCLKMESL